MNDVVSDEKVAAANGVAGAGGSSKMPRIRSGFDAWLTKMAFRFMLIKRAYSKEEFIRMAEESRFGSCQINAVPVGFEVRFTKPARIV
jgi:hypothetical protein